MPLDSDRSFSASYDSLTKFITAGLFVVLVVVTIAAKSMLLGCLLLLIHALGYAYSPRGYNVSEGWLSVRRLIGNVRIPLSGAREVRPAVPDDLKGCIRIFGSGGFFGYYGLYRTSKLGKSSWHVTNRDNAVVLITAGKTYVLSPDDVNGFVMAVQSAAAMPADPRVDAASGSALAGRGRERVGMVVGVGIGILVALLVAASLLYSPGPPKYTLTPEELVIHDRFYPARIKAAEVDVEGIRVVDIGTDAHWKPTVRTNGFANAHYRAGWFRVAGGEKVRMYRADSRRLVLLPSNGKGEPVLIEVAEPEKFIEQVRKAWR